MKRIILTVFTVMLFTSCEILSQMGVPLSEADVANGLKEALIQGVNRGGTSLFSTAANGNSALLNELLPKDVVSILGTARSLGLGSQIDKVSGNLNKAAVSSAQKAMPIFINAIRSMSVTDAWGILRGDKNAATVFLRKATSVALTSAIQPEVNGVFSSVGLKPTLLGNLGVKNPLLNGLDIDMTGLLTNMVTAKMYEKIESEEARVRTDVSARTSDLMRRVFAATSSNMPNGLNR